MKILLACDDSIYSQSAADAVLARSWPENTTIRVVSAIDANDEPSESSENEEELATNTPADPGSLLSLKRTIIKIAKSIKEKFPELEVTHSILYGDTKEKILDYASYWPADLVVIGSHGRKGLSRVLLGSVSQTVLTYCDSNALVVRRKKDEQTKSPKVVEHVLIPVDSADHSRRALDWVVSLAWDHNCHFKVLTIVPSLAGAYSDGLSMLQGEKLSAERLKTRKEAEVLLELSKNKLREKFPEERISVELFEGDPGDVILAKATSWTADLIVMGTRGHGGLKRLWLGSVSQEIAMQAPCAVEVVKRLIES